MVELVTRNYTDVIFDLAKEENQVVEIGAELEGIASILEQNPEFIMLLSSPQITKIDKLKAVDEIFQGKISSTTLNFIKVLIDNRRSEYLLEIAKRYKNNEREFLGIAYVEATTAVPMDEDQKQKLVKTLETKLGKQIELNNMIDSSIIGGMKIKIGEKALDGTLTNRLKELQSEISK